MPAKFKRCVQKVKRKQRGKHGKKVNPYAVCRVSTGFMGSTRENRRSKR